MWECLQKVTPSPRTFLCFSISPTLCLLLLTFAAELGWVNTFFKLFSYLSVIAHSCFFFPCRSALSFIYFSLCSFLLLSFSLSITQRLTVGRHCSGYITHMQNYTKPTHKSACAWFLGDMRVIVPPTPRTHRTKRVYLCICLIVCYRTGPSGLSCLRRLSVLSEMLCVFCHPFGKIFNLFSLLDYCMLIVSFPFVWPLAKHSNLT